MILTQARPTDRKLCRRGQGSQYDPSQLSTALRELAVRAHRLVRATDESGSGPRPCTGSDLAFDVQRELTEVHAQIVQLERNLCAHNLDGLAAYVWALRQRVQEYLA